MATPGRVSALLAQHRQKDKQKLTTQNIGKNTGKNSKKYNLKTKQAKVIQKMKSQRTHGTTQSKNLNKIIIKQNRQK